MPGNDRNDRSNRNNRNNNNRDWDIQPSKVQTWIKEGFVEKTIDYTNEFGGFLASQGLTTNQIRNIFGEVKRLQSIVKAEKGLKSIKKDFLMLRPKLAYAAKRAGSRGIEALKDVLGEAHKSVDTTNENAKEQFENFVDFFEAILAYHKANGGRDSKRSF